MGLNTINEEKIEQFKIGDKCRYDIYDCSPNDDGTPRKITCDVTLLKELKSKTGWEVRVDKVYNDDSGNGFYEYLCRTNDKNTVNVSSKYLTKLEES